MLRKQIIEPGSSPEPGPSEGIDVAASATVMVTSESPDHPVDHAFDARRGPGGSRWIAGGPGEQRVILAFDAPRLVHRIALEIEETECSRTQEIWLEVSDDGGETYRQVIRQEYNFSPTGSTFEREDWTIAAQAVTHLRLTVKPDKGGGDFRASLTSMTVW